MTSALPFRSTLSKSKWLLQIKVIVTQTSNISSTITSTSLYHSQHYLRRTEITKIIISSSSNKGTFCICTVIWSSQTFRLHDFPLLQSKCALFIPRDGCFTLLLFHMCSNLWNRKQYKYNLSKKTMMKLNVRS